MNHVLSLEIPDTLNTKLLRIIDMSDYNENMPVKCPRLEVTPPGFSYSIKFQELEPGFNLNLTTCNLGLQTYDCDSNRLDLTDGIYVIRYSVSPNDTVYCEYNYLKVSSLLSRYRCILCSLPLDGSEPDDEMKEKLNLLSQINMYIQAAKVKAEDCGEPKKAMELYTYAQKLLNKFDCGGC